jgi:hypothetical protein
MKQTFIRRTAKAMFFATVLLATCLSASSAQTGSAFEGKFEGKFTLPYEAHWGEAVLPAGDYLFSLPTIGVPAMVIVQDAKSGRTVALVAPAIRQDSAEGESALFVGTRGAQRVIYSLRVSQLGVVFISDPALARGKRTAEEARKTDVIPVLQAKR